MGRMRVVSLNVHAGGGRRTRQIADAVAAHEPNVAVICEAYPRGERLGDELARIGLRNSAVAIDDARRWPAPSASSRASPSTGSASRSPQGLTTSESSRCRSATCGSPALTSLSSH